MASVIVDWIQRSRKHEISPFVSAINGSFMSAGLTAGITACMDSNIAGFWSTGYLSRTKRFGIY
jgi:hypothetical protein